MSILGSFHVDLRDLSIFLGESLVQDSLLLRCPAQFQQEINVIHMYNIPVGMPLEESRFKEREQKLEEEVRSNVLLVTDFDQVRTLEAIHE